MIRIQLDAPTRVELQALRRTALPATGPSLSESETVVCSSSTAHRVAKGLIEKRKTVAAVILTEEETRACVLEGQMARFERETR